MKMKQILWIIGVVLCTGLPGCVESRDAATESAGSNEINFVTADSVQIIADLYVSNKTAPTILLFHQGGSNARAEYVTIIPRLMEKGYNIIAIDQRRGGQRYGSYNRTIARMPESNFSYCDAYADLENTLDYLIRSGFSGSKILWGSSYSASLAIKLANNRPEAVDAVLAFSPASGGPMEGCRPDEYFETLQVPLLLLRPKGEMEIASVQAQFDLARENNHQVYIAENGVHGSSMLVAKRVKADVAENWQIVESFISSVIEAREE